MDLNDPIVIALIKLFAKRYRFFCDLYDGRFRLITNWLTEDWTGYTAIRTPAAEDIPWYAHSQNLYILAEILKVCPGELYIKIKELEKEEVL